MEVKIFGWMVWVFPIKQGAHYCDIHVQMAQNCFLRLEKLKKVLWRQNGMIFWVTSPWSFPKKSRLRVVNFKRIRFELSKFNYYWEIQKTSIFPGDQKSPKEIGLSIAKYSENHYFSLMLKKSQLNWSPLCEIYRKHVYFWKVPIKSDFQKWDDQYIPWRSKNPN